GARDPHVEEVGHERGLDALSLRDSHRLLQLLVDPTTRHGDDHLVDRVIPQHSPEVGDGTQDFVAVDIAPDAARIPVEQPDDSNPPVGAYPEDLQSSPGPRPRSNDEDVPPVHAPALRAPDIPDDPNAVPLQKEKAKHTEHEEENPAHEVQL